MGLLAAGKVSGLQGRNMPGKGMGEWRETGRGGFSPIAAVVGFPGSVGSRNP